MKQSDQKDSAVRHKALDLHGDGLDAERVLSWMCFPSSRHLREARFVRKLIDRRLEQAHDPATMLSISACDLKLLVDSPTRAEVDAAATEATKRGTVAGDLLALIYQMYRLGSKEPSFGKAVSEYKAFALGKKYGDNEALKYSEQTLRNYWNEFLPVAHLWAGFRLNQGPYAYAPGINVFHDASAFQRMLGVAAAMGDFATGFIPLRTKPPKPIIAPGDLLSIPASVPRVQLVMRSPRLV